MIYLYHAASSPCPGPVIEAVRAALEQQGGNPSAVHRAGRKARAAVEEAREQVALALGARADEIIFTSGGTEANNLAILGTARALSHQGRHLVASTVEHPSVLNPLRQLAAQGWEITLVPVDDQGRVRPDELLQALRPDTVLVSIMHTQNETGTIQPVGELAPLVRRHGILFHCDASQGLAGSKVMIDQPELDLLTVSGHKLGAPKGTGALYRRRKTPLAPLVFGGGQ